MSEVLPYTERKNSLSARLSDVSVKEMLQIVVDCHKQIFTENYRPLYALASFVPRLDAFSSKAAEFLKSGHKTAIILGGCGTSGRMCALASLNQAIHFPNSNVDVIYSPAGGDESLFRSLELVEDDAVLGRANLETASANYDRVVYIGISVGLWAPYVAGQLDFALKNREKFLPAVIGFNPPHLARNVPIPKLNRTFREIVFEMEERGDLTVTPVILPEALSGSSRMKGGVATIVILDLLFSCLNAKLCTNYKSVDLDSMLASFAAILEHQSLVSDDFVSLLTFIAEKMRNGGGMRMEAENVIGILACFDCTETEPTFNAAPGEVIYHLDMSDLDATVDWTAEKMFLPKGKGQAQKLISFSAAFQKAEAELASEIPEDRPTNNDVTLKVSLCTKQQGQATLVLSTPNDLSKKAEFPLNFDGSLYEFDRFKDFYVQVLAKLVFQLASTVVFSQLGKVYKNIMIDVKTSNSKLLHRAIRSVSDVTGCEIATSRRAIIAAIRQIELHDVVADVPDDNLIKESADLTQIVPCAVVIVLTGCSPTEAFKLVRGRRRLCEIVNELLTTKQN